MAQFVTKFFDALRESIITQSIITVLVVGAWIYLVVSSLPIPQELTQTMFIIIGFYFGSKVGFRQGEKSIQHLLHKRADDVIRDSNSLDK